MSQSEMENWNKLKYTSRLQILHLYLDSNNWNQKFVCDII